MLRRALLFTAVFLGFGGFAWADSLPVGVSIQAGGNGPGPNGYGGEEETLTGTLQFNPSTLTVSNVILTGILITSDGSENATENWDFGPLTVTASSVNGWDVVNFDGYAGSLGDVLNFYAFLYPDGSGGFVPSFGATGVLSENPATQDSDYLDNWAGSLTPTPEPATWLLLGAGLLVIVAKGWRR
jgi:hypothetical protein